MMCLFWYEASACIPSSEEAARDAFQAAHKVTHSNYIIHIWRFISVEPWEQNKRHFLFAEIFLRCANVAALLLLNFFFFTLTLHAKSRPCVNNKGLSDEGAPHCFSSSNNLTAAYPSSAPRGSRWLPLTCSRCADSQLPRRQRWCQMPAVHICSPPAAVVGALIQRTLHTNKMPQPLSPTSTLDQNIWKL